MASVESIKPGGSRTDALGGSCPVTTVGHTDATGRVPPEVAIETDALGGSRPIATANPASSRRREARKDHPDR